MEIKIKHYDTIVTIKIEHDNLSLEETFDILNAALLDISWQQNQINDYINEKAEELKCKE